MTAQEHSCKEHVCIHEVAIDMGSSHMGSRCGALRGLVCNIMSFPLVAWMNWVPSLADTLPLSRPPAPSFLLWLSLFSMTVDRTHTITCVFSPILVYGLPPSSRSFAGLLASCRAVVGRLMVPTRYTRCPRVSLIC
jgi:hypothetical protein